MFPGIIIARGGSKRVPRKNVKDFCGRPLVEWTIIQAKAALGIDPVVLITDDDEIAEIGKTHDILVFMRPTTADNVAGSTPFNMAINKLLYMGYKFDAFVSLLPTGPLRLPGDIDKGITLFCHHYLKKKNLQIISMSSITSLLFVLIKEDITKGIDYKGSELTYAENGLFSIHPIKLYRQVTQPYDHIQVEKFRRIARRKVSRIPYICKSWQGADIDTPEEFEFCEIVFKHYLLDKEYYK